MVLTSRTACRRVVANGVIPNVRLARLCVVADRIVGEIRTTVHRVVNALEGPAVWVVPVLVVHLVERDSTPTVEAVVLGVISRSNDWWNDAVPITNGVVTPQTVMIMSMEIAHEMPSISAMDVSAAVVA